MATFIINDGKRPLSYWYGNANGSIKDFMGFSWNNYMIFSSKKDAIDKIKGMLDEVRGRELEFKLALKLENKIDSLKISMKKDDGSYSKPKLWRIA